MELTKYTILIVEDDPDSLRLLQFILSKAGAKMIIAETGKEAIEQFDLHPEIDLVLMDIRLPDFTGLELTRLFKSKRSQIPVIAQTAHAMIAERQKCMEAGCDAYLTKPLRRDLLFQSIDRLLD